MATIVEYKGKKPQVGQRVFLAEGVRLIGDVKIGDDSSIFYNSVLRGDLSSIVIGERTNIQDNVTIHLSLDQGVVVGNNVTVGHNVVLHACIVEDNALIGMGAIIMDGARIRKNCVVGAGSLVPQGKEYPEGSLIVGSPARVVRALTEEELQRTAAGVAHYVEVKDELLKNA